MGNTIYRNEKQILQMMENVKGVLQRLADQGMRTVRQNAFSDLCKEIFESIHIVNKTLFILDTLKINRAERILADLDAALELEGLIGEMEEWINLCHETIRRREGCKNYLDERFYRLIDMIDHCDYEEIYRHVCGELRGKHADIRKALNAFYQYYHYFWGSLDIERDSFETVELRLKELISHRDDFVWLFEELGDYRSKYVLTGFLEYWINYDPGETLGRIRETMYGDYFDLDLIEVLDDEVLVDLGAYTGDTVQEFIRSYNRYKGIYCFEVSPHNVARMKEELAEFENVHLIQKAAGAEKGTIQMKIEEVVSTDNSLSSDHKGKLMDIEVATVDDEVSEPVTMIKMDIEGAEADALEGCRKHILKEQPKLMISVYHNNTDIWKIPRMVREMYPGYRLYLRANGRQWGPSEIVLFALP